MTSKYSDEQFEAAYQLSFQVISQIIEKKEAVNVLVSYYAIEQSEAKGIVDLFVSALLFKAEKYGKRLINYDILKYLLNRIKIDYRDNKFRIALVSTRNHLDNWKKSNNVPLIKHFELLDEMEKSEPNKFEIKIGNMDFSDTTTLQNLLDEEYIEVKKSSNKTSVERLAAIDSASSLPTQTVRKVIVFSRNKDVIAETLFQAGGVCQKCEKPAPFKRQSDQTPYLEVHHKIPLSEKGPDKLENAIALCPNCHREAHHGVNWEQFRK